MWHIEGYHNHFHNYITVILCLQLVNKLLLAGCTMWTERLGVRPFTWPVCERVFWELTCFLLKNFCKNREHIGLKTRDYAQKSV